MGLLAIGLFVAACSGDAAATPPISPGTAARPRDVNIIAKDYSFLPPVVDLVPGETVLLHVINGGLEVHEVVIGDSSVQDAWEAAEAAAANPPPGPDAGRPCRRPWPGCGSWSSPASGSTCCGPSRLDPGPLLIGCHIPGHWAKGMQAAIRLVTPGAVSPAGRSGPPSTQP